MMGWLHSRQQFVFAFHYAAFFATVGIVLPFWPKWLAGQGLTSDQVGTVLAAAFFAKILFVPLFSALSDKTRRRKTCLVFVAGVFLGCLLMLRLELSYWQVLMAWMVGGALTSTLIPLSDSLFIAAARRTALDYGRARLWGSLSFIAVSSLAGAYFTGQNTDIILLTLTGLAGFSLLVTLFLPVLTGPRLSEQARYSVGELLRLPGYVLFILTAGVLQASHAALYGFATLHWSNAGLSDTMIGSLWAEGVVIEVLVFAFGARLLRLLGVRGLLFAAVSGGLVRWLTLGVTADLVWLILVQTLHACTFAATHLAVVTHIGRIVPEHLASSAQGLYDVLAMGLIFSGAMWVSGALYGSVGGQVFWAMAGMSFVGGVLLSLQWRRLNGADPCG